MRRSWAGAVALVLWLAGAVAIAASAVLSGRNLDSGAFDQGAISVALLGGFTGVGVVGAVVARHRPDNRVGWLFLGIFVALAALAYAQEHAIYALVTAPEAVPGGVLAAWVASWAWYPTIGAMLVFVPLLFPTGRPLSPRWRAVGWAGGVALAATTVNAALAETLVLGTGDYLGVASMRNPIGIRGVQAEEGVVFDIASVVLGVAMVAAVASLVVRYRRSRGDERQQLKWFVFAGAVLPIGTLSDVLALPDVIQNVVFASMVLLVPLAAGLAILRYRLYDIDRIISRTVSYALLTGLLAAVYLGVVFILQQLLRPITGESQLSVAGATLAVAALFGPLRRRVQAAVDRRFNRARYDARRIVEQFRHRLRDEVDLDQLDSEVVGAVNRTVEPTQVSLWLRPRVSHPHS